MNRFNPNPEQAEAAYPVRQLEWDGKEYGSPLVRLQGAEKTIENAASAAYDTCLCEVLTIL
ncbi:MAG TPA: hypothetical protein PK052_08720 [Anaerohalosphaeraceae bacterium]|nr:hypothetical protein [Phycisphaerae bacterium]HOK96864.1 hypothetical protein [Anaerohalosphaeraceae bacterium]HOL32052.1 hypothetical protein [Anaerohalosphaeraceae bacterium]HPO70509.1 hypothetical protein [Anaerohalosphaeraceae bacterium]